MANSRMKRSVLGSKDLDTALEKVTLLFFLQMPFFLATWIIIAKRLMLNLVVAIPLLVACSCASKLRRVYPDSQYQLIPCKIFSILVLTFTMLAALVLYGCTHMFATRPMIVAVCTVIQFVFFCIWCRVYWVFGQHIYENNRYMDQEEWDME